MLWKFQKSFHKQNEYLTLKKKIYVHKKQDTLKEETEKKQTTEFCNFEIRVIKIGYKIAYSYCE